MRLANDDERAMADYVRKVREAVQARGGSDAQTFACLTTVLCQYNQRMTRLEDIEELAALIAEHG